MNPFSFLTAAFPVLHRWVLLGLFVLASLSAAAQSTLHFSNYGAGIGSDAKVLDAQGNPLGSAFRGQLYSSAPGGTLAPVSSSVPFRNHPTTGAGTGYVIGAVISLPGVPENGTAQVQLRVWAASGGDSYESALAAGVPTGASATFFPPTGGGLTPPAPLSGLQGFRLVPRFALTLNRNPANGGTIQATPPPGADGNYAANTTVMLTAQPAAGFVLTGWTGAATGAALTTTVKLTDDATVTAGFRATAAGTVQFNQAAPTVPEAGGQVVLTVNRTGGTDGAVTVRYQLGTGGTATAGSDFSFSAGTLSWASGDGAAKTFAVGIANDSSMEEAETIRVQLATPTGGVAIGAASLATIIITDDDIDDIAGTLQFEQVAWWGTEAGGTATVAVTRTGGRSGAVSVAYATSDGTARAPGDYTATSGRLSWASGDTAPKSFQVPLKTDALVEPTETINLTLSAPQGGAIIGGPGVARLYLALKEPDAWLEMFAGVYVRGTVGRTYQILAGTNLTPEETWPVVAVVTLTKAVELWIDPETPMRKERFYRFREKQ